VNPGSATRATKNNGQEPRRERAHAQIQRGSGSTTTWVLMDSSVGAPTQLAKQRGR